MVVPAARPLSACSGSVDIWNYCSDVCLFHQALHVCPLLGTRREGCFTASQQHNNLFHSHSPTSTGRLYTIVACHAVTPHSTYRTIPHNGDIQLCPLRDMTKIYYASIKVETPFATATEQMIVATAHTYINNSICKLYIACCNLAKWV